MREEDKKLCNIYVSKEHTRSFNFPYQVGTGATDTQIGAYFELLPEEI